jgi:hypothetical protein
MAAMSVRRVWKFSRHHSLESTQSVVSSFSQGYVHMYTKLLEIISVGFDVTDQLLIRFLAFVRY